MSRAPDQSGTVVGPSLVCRSVLAGTIVLLLALGQTVVAPAMAADGEEEARPPLAKLLKLNAEQIFGASPSIKEGRVSFHFKKWEEFQKIFEGEGLRSPGDLKRMVNPRVFKKSGGKDDIPDVVAGGLEEGEWFTRFPLAEDFKVEFNIKIAKPVRGGSINLLVNRKDRRNMIVASLFQFAHVVEDGRRGRPVRAAASKFAGPPERWAEETVDGAPVAIEFADGALRVRVGDETALELTGAENLTHGKLGLQFRKMSFIISNLRLSTRIDREWCEEQFKALEGRQLLKLEEESAPQLRKMLELEKAKKSTLRDSEAEIDL